MSTEKVLLSETESYEFAQDYGELQTEELSDDEVVERLSAEYGLPEEEVRAKIDEYQDFFSNRSQYLEDVEGDVPESELFSSGPRSLGDIAESLNIG